MKQRNFIGRLVGRLRDQNDWSQDYFAERLQLAGWHSANVREMLQTFAHDQRQVLRLWKDDVTAQMREHLDQKYPGHDMSIVVESFDYKMSRALAQRPAQAQNQNRGVRI